ncbi:MAG: sigma-E processing peptidase SpoIIGA [Firmicutes bacterium]|nr:sigma-E processing peptidase SpoIIGA [Alicyclobacillaceae bacterium]MCL6497763.1 sigma-E processing peptidase SpoIIGA [Bacillota bacterium]
MTVWAWPTLAINGGWDAALVWAAGRWSGRRVRVGPLLAAAAAGTLPLLWVLSRGNRYAFPGWLELVWPCLMLRIGLGSMSRPGFLRALLSFWGMGLGAAGLSWALAAWVGPDGAAAASRWVPAVAVAGVGWWAPRWSARGAAVIRHYGLLRLELGGRRVELAMLWDSGNRLRDPVSGRPVAVVEWDAVRDWVPEEVRGWAEAVLAGRMGSPPERWRERAGVVRYATVAGPGQMPVVAVDRAWAWDGAGAWQELVPVMAGFAVGPLSPRGGYRALVAPEARRRTWNQGVVGA